MRITVLRRPLAVTVLSLLPGSALASDPTPLFVFVFGLPAALGSILLVWLACRFPKAALASAIVFLGAHVPLMSWAYRVGYMDTAGGWLYFSAALGVVSLVLAIVRIGRRRRRGVPSTTGSGIDGRP